MKTKQIFLSAISILIISLTSGYAQNPVPLPPIQLQETGIISHLMLVKQTSEYRTGFFINIWMTKASALKAQMDTFQNAKKFEKADSLRREINLIQNSIDSISVKYTRLQIAYDRIIIQLDYVINSRNKVLFMKRLNRKIRKQGNIEINNPKGTSHMKLFINNLKTCHSEFEKFNSDILRIDLTLTKRIQTYKLKNADAKDITDPLTAPITAVLGIIETGIGIYTSIDELNGKRVDDVSKLLQACRFKSVSELSGANSPKKEQEKKEDEKNK